MEFQIFDADYVVLNNKPIIRLFCKDPQGETVCVFYENFLPYFYLHGDESKYDEITEEILLKYPNAKVEVVERLLPIGYQPSVKVLKITGTNPQLTPDMREYVKAYGTPYEADILFRYRFMSDFGLKGMCWIDVNGKYIKTNTVKCKSVQAESIKPLERTDNAPLRYMAVDIECLSTGERIPTPEKDMIIIVSMYFSPDYKNKKSLVIVGKHAKVGPDTILCANEKEMLEKFYEIVKDYDPDIICGHNINGFDMPFLITRMEILGIQRDIGRSEKPAMIRKLAMSNIPSISGRVVVDSYELYKKDPWIKFKRYDLSTISKELLGEGKMDLGAGNFLKKIRDQWNSGDLVNFVEYSRKDAELSLRLVVERRILDKFFEVAKLSGLVLQDALGGQSQRHECRLLREFGKRNYIMPCKPGERTEDGEQHGLKGAIVLDPEVGLHEWIVCLDFTSMYPSLIKAFNICTTTFMMNGGDADHFVSPYGTKFVKPEVMKGIIPQIIDEGMTARKETRKKLKAEPDQEKRRLLEAKQLALKDMLNSLYGYTGYARSRLYVMDIANTITAFGRDTIMRTRDLIEKNFDVKVIYADTDSVFIKCPVKDLDGAEEFGMKVSKFITEQLYGLDLKFEKTYKSFLIEAKKRYAGWAFERGADGQWKGKMDMKGIETVRRDWCDIVSQTMKEVLDIVLKEKDINRASRHVRTIIESISRGEMPFEKLTIIKGVTKDVTAYDGVQPHIELAKKLMQRDKSRSVIGERLGYVIIRGNQLVSKRAEDPEFAKENNLALDTEYYIYNQLLPPIERIFEVCGVSSSELIEGVRQKNLMDIMNGEKKLSPDETVLRNFESVVCVACGNEMRRPNLSGKCPKCSGKLYFSRSGSIGSTVNYNK
jgi:DNA polymerase, archaea type